MHRAESSHYFYTQERYKIIFLFAAIIIFSFAHWFFSSVQLWGMHAPLKIWMLDIGQGDAMLLEFPNGEQFLIDGGPDDSVLQKLGSILGPWDRTLDAIILTHPDADHVGGIISVLKYYDVKKIYESGLGAYTPFGRAYEVAREKEHAQHMLLSSNKMIQIGEARLTVLWPDETQTGRYPEKRNDLSLVIRLDYGNTSMLFTADTEETSENSFASRAGDIDILKVGHHGSLTSTSWALLENTNPEFAIISAGENNSYGHPHPIILHRLNEVHTQIFRTDLDGDLLITSRGHEPTIVSHPLPF